MSIEKELLDKAKLYKKLTKLSLVTIGKQAANNAHIFTRLQNGDSCTVASYNKINAWLDEKLSALQPSKKKGGK